MSLAPFSTFGAPHRRTVAPYPIKMVVFMPLHPRRPVRPLKERRQTPPTFEDGRGELRGDLPLKFLTIPEHDPAASRQLEGAGGEVPGADDQTMDHRATESAQGVVVEAPRGQQMVDPLLAERGVPALDLDDHPLTTPGDEEGGADLAAVGPGPHGIAATGEQPGEMLLQRLSTHQAQVDHRGGADGARRSWEDGTCP